MVEIMDWSKAKTILIIAFIITNILLVYVIKVEESSSEPTLTDEFIEDVVELLKDKNIYIDTEIPKEIPHLNVMTVEYENISLEELNENYFDNAGNINFNDDSLGHIEKGEQSILLMNNRRIIYENREDRELYKDLDRDKAIDLAEEFIRKGKFDSSDMKLTFVKEDGGVFYLEYSKVYMDTLVERAFTNLQIDKRGVRRFERLWLKEIDIGETQIYINTAPKSLLTLLSMEEIYGKTITDISLCYYFDPQRHEYLDEPGRAKQGNAIPAWRIQFHDGYKVYIDDY